MSIFSEPLVMLSVIVIGFVVGLSIGVSGFGGSPILFPFLLLLGIPPHVVVGTDLAFSFLTKSFATVVHTKIRNVNWRVVSYLLLPVIPTMIFGGWLWIFIKNNLGSTALDNIILTFLGILLAIIATYVFSLRKMTNVKFGSTDYLLEHRTVFSKKSRNFLLSGGVLVTFVTQITSSGAGAMLLPLLIRIIRSPKFAAGTSVVVGVAISGAGALFHFALGNIEMHLLITLMIGSIPGVLLGIKIGSVVSFQKIMTIMAIIVVIAAVFLLGKGIASILIS